MEGLKHYRFNAQKREELITESQSKEYDVVIIGGGITGAGILLDATSRGLSAILIEKNDFASGTSSRSTKLIHGGLRYLKNFEFNLVRSVGKERAIAYKNAPHLVVPEKMILPLIKGGTYGKTMTNFGLWLYDLLAGVKGKDKRKILSKQATLQQEPLLRNDILLGSGYYAEYRTDDARLTLEIIKTACNRKGTALNYLQVNNLLYKDNEVCGVSCSDLLSPQKTMTIKGKHIVNAAGPWVDQIRTLDNSLKNKRLHLTKGIHIVLPSDKLPVNNSIYFDTSDGRMIFTIPRMGVTYIGTTDTNYQEDIDCPNATKADVNYLIDATNQMFPEAKLTEKDVVSSWAGLRPLIHEEGKSPSELSRKDEIFVSESNLITIAGGKLTGYRLMAKKVVDLVCSKSGIKHQCITDDLKISGGEFETPDMVESFIFSIKSRLKSMGLDEEKATYLVRNYGKKAKAILEVFQAENFTLLCEAEAWFCLRFEMTLTLLDFFDRRTGKINFFTNEIDKDIPLVTPIFQSFLNWNDQEVKNQVHLLKTEIKNRTTFL